jgi:hypothetical protein
MDQTRWRCVVNFARTRDVPNSEILLSGNQTNVNQLPHTMSMRAADIYRDCLLLANQGYPLYQPELDERLPADSAYEAYRSEGIGVGDVGIIRAEGNFDFLFNICKSAPTLNPHATPNAYNVMEEFRVTLPTESSSSARSGSLSTFGAAGEQTLASHVDDSNVPRRTAVTFSGGQDESEVVENTWDQTFVGSPASPAGIELIDAGKIRVKRNHISADQPYIARGKETQTSVNVELSSNAIK